MRAGDFRQPLDERAGIAQRGDVEHERIEIVVVVLGFRVVVRRPRRNIVLRARLEAERDIRIDPPLLRRDDLG